MNHWLNRLRWLYAQLTATPRRRLALWALLAWLDVRLLQAGLTIVTLPGTLATRFSHWMFWDGSFYLGIAQHGYQPPIVRQAAFFPVYPALAHLLLRLNLPADVALLLVANLGSLVALVLVGWLVYHETQNERAALVALLLLAVSPLGVFLSGMYSDGLFVALVAGGWLAARSQHWRIAGLLLAAAVITRPFGLALAIALLVEFCYQRQPWRNMLWLVVPSLISLSGFLLVLWHTYDSPLISLQVERVDFSHRLQWPWQTAALTLHQMATTPLWSYDQAHLWLDALPVLLCLLCVAVVVRKWPASFSVYVCACVLLCVVNPIIYPHGAQDALASDGRYLYAAAPLVLLPLACWMTTHWPRWAIGVVLGVSLAIHLLLVGFVLHGGWLV